LSPMMLRDASLTDSYKAFRHIETLFVQGRNLHLAGLLLVIQGLFTFRQPIAGLQGTDFYPGQIKFPHVETPYSFAYFVRNIVRVDPALGRFTQEIDSESC